MKTATKTKQSLPKFILIGVAVLCVESFAEISITKLDSSFFDFGVEYDGSFSINALSKDGSTIAGQAYPSQGGPYTAFASKNLGAPEFLTSPDSTLSSFVRDISGDGSIVVGRSVLEHSGSYSLIELQSLIWDRNNGGAQPLLTNSGSASSVSPNGTYITGYTLDDLSNPDKGGSNFIWDETNGFVERPGFGDYDVSNNGTVVGGGQWNNTTREAYRWNAEDGIQELDGLRSAIIEKYDTDIVPRYFNFDASYIADDDSMIIGNYSYDLPLNSSGSFRWSPDGDIQLFDDFRFLNASDDGSTMVGYGLGGPQTFPALWTSSTGIENFNSYLTDKGADMDGVEFDNVFYVSGDGSTFVGENNHEYNTWYFVSGLEHTSVPDVPATGILLLSGLGGLFVLRKKIYKRV